MTLVISKFSETELKILVLLFLSNKPLMQLLQNDQRYLSHYSSTSSKAKASYQIFYLTPNIFRTAGEVSDIYFKYFCCLIFIALFSAYLFIESFFIYLPICNQFLSLFTLNSRR